MSEGVFERANHQARSSAHWCTDRPHARWHRRPPIGGARVSIVAVCTAPGTAAATTTSLLLGRWHRPPRPRSSPSATLRAATSRRGPASPPEPGWSTAVAAPQPTWSVIERHAQALPNGPRVITASSRPSQARGPITRGRVVVRVACSPPSPDVLAVADCGRVDTVAPAWVGVAQLSLLLVRQAPTAGATVARVDRAIEVLDVLSAACPWVGVVLIGRAPYPPAEVEAALGMALFATLPEDPAGAALACGGWTIGRGAGRSALAQSGGRARPPRRRGGRRRRRRAGVHERGVPGQRARASWPLTRWRSPLQQDGHR